MSADLQSDIQSTPVAEIPIVAIGGSAGGQEAVTELLSRLPNTTGFGFVYIQHLSAAHESHLDNILGHVTTMPVVKAGHMMAVQANHVYIIPPNQEMEIQEGSLILTPRRKTMHMPIDRFFTSLAERQRTGTIAILLSGLAHDGTLGLKAVKAAGGITMAQDSTAKFDTMPKSAIAEGVVDLVLPPHAIAEELHRLSQRSHVLRLTTEPNEGPDPDGTEEGIPRPTEDELTAIDDNDLKPIIRLINKTIGVDFRQYKTTTIRRRIIRRMLLYKLDSITDYTNYLRGHPDEVRTLYNDLLINVTAFFRDTEAMLYLSKVLIPQLVKNQTAYQPLRIWVPGCSTGQEAYSLVMMLMETMGEAISSPPIHVFATDLSEPAIARARLGVYTKSEVADISPRRLRQFFTKVDDKYRIHKNVRDLCVFATHNLFKDPPFSRLDFISCRNLLIYLDTDLQKKAFSTFHYALKSNGLLFLGKSETAGTAAGLFTAVEKNYRVYSRRNNGSLVLPGLTTLDRNGGSISQNRTESEQMDDIDKKGYAPPPPASDLTRRVDNLLLNQYIPAAVVVDQELEILQFRGSTGLFLEPAPGKASLNLLKMARPALTFELRNAVHKAQKSGQPVRKSGLTLTVNGHAHQVAIEAVPLAGEGDHRLFLVLFIEEKLANSINGSAEGGHPDRIRQLEDELASLREDMHSIIEAQEVSNEELQSANEEIVSSNEELQSINEELETSKEEIESTNEELLTINQELQVRNDQLTEAYGYAEAIFDTISEATLVLDKDLRVKSANQAFYSIFKVNQQDTEGKLLFELGNGQWDITPLRQLLGSVISQNANVQSYEVTHTFPGIGEKIMRLNARKVVQQQRQEAVLLAIEDISDHRRAQRLLEERQAWFRDLMDNAPTLVWVASADAALTFVNRAWLDYTGASRQDVIGKSLMLNVHPEDYDTYLTLYGTNFLRRQSFSTEYRLQRQDGTYRWMLTNARPQFGTDGSFMGYIGTSQEIHLQKTLNQELDLRVQQRTRQWAEANARLEQANLELQQTADRLQSLLNSVPASITMMEVVRDENGEPIDFTTSAYNESALALQGRSAEDILARSMLEAYPFCRTNGIFDQYVQVLTTGEAIYEEHELELPVKGFYAFYITRQIDANGLVVTVLNITDRKNAEAQVRRTAESLQAVLDSSPASIGLLKATRNEQGEVVDFTLSACNQKFVELSGHPPASLIGESATAFNDVFWFDKTFENLLHILTTGEPMYEERHDTRQGSDNWLALSLNRHDDGVLVTGLDITALKQADQQRDSWLKELERSNEMLLSLEGMREHIRQRGEFLRATSHDLRGSFSVIEGAASLLNQMDTEEDRDEMLAMLQRNLRQATQMLSQLLDYSRLEAGYEEIHHKPFDAAVMLHEMIAGLQPMATQQQLALWGEGPESLPVEGDGVKFGRIAQNLVLNGLKYSDKGGVKVSWTREPAGNHWNFSVQDTGPGLPPSLITMLTAPPTTETEQAKSVNGKNAQSSASATGEGIGLFIVKRLCNLLGGRIAIECEPGKGTLIQLELPLTYTSLPDSIR